MRKMMKMTRKTSVMRSFITVGLRERSSEVEVESRGKICMAGMIGATAFLCFVG